jgi:hypothetical protein
MSATKPTAAGINSRVESEQSEAKLWTPPEERPPTEAEEARARQQSLEANNETEIGYDHKTDFFNPSWLSYEDREYYKKLDSHNRDNYWKNRVDVDDVGQDADRQLKLKTTLGIASQLSLSDFQTQLVLDRIFRIDGQRFGQRTEAVAFCLCVVVVNEGAGERYGDDNVYHPARSDSNNDEEFVRVRDQLIETFGPITESRLYSIHGKLTQGNPPETNNEDTQRFASSNSTIQRHPSYAPDYALSKSTGEC